MERKRKTRSIRIRALFRLIPAVSNTILDFCGAISYLPFSIAFAMKPRPIQFSPHISGTIMIHGGGGFVMDPKRLAPKYRMGGKEAIADIMTKDELIPIRMSLAGSNSNFNVHSYLPSLHLSRWYEAIDLKIHKGKASVPWKPTSSSHPEISPDHTLDDAIWMTEAMNGGNRHLQAMRETREPSGGEAFEWIGYHFGLIRLDQVGESAWNVIGPIKSGCYDTAQEFIERGDFIAAQSAAREPLCRLRHNDFTDEDTEDLIAGETLLEANLEAISFMVEKGILNLNDVKGEHIAFDKPQHVRWFVERGVSMVSIFRAPIDDFIIEFVREHKKILPSDDLAGILVAGFVGCVERRATGIGEDMVGRWIEFVIGELFPLVERGSKGIALREMKGTGNFKKGDIEMRIVRSLSRKGKVKRSLVDEYKKCNGLEKMSLE